MNTAPTFSEWDLTDQPCIALAEDDHCWCISPVLTYSALFWVMCNKEPQTALLNLWQKCFILTAGSSANNKMSLIKWVQWDDRMDLHSNRQMGQHPRKPPEVFFTFLEKNAQRLGPAWSCLVLGGEPANASCGSLLCAWNGLSDIVTAAAADFPKMETPVIQTFKGSSKI